MSAAVEDSSRNRFFGLPIRPLTRRRLDNFTANRRGFWSLWIFLALFGISLFAELIANDRPILIRYDGATYAPFLTVYAETEFGGEFPTEADYTDPFVVELIEKKGWIWWPPIRFRYDTNITDLAAPAPSQPTVRNWLGTDDQSRDVVARMIYGFRLSVAFGLILTVLSSIVGVAAGAIQGFFGGLTDLIGQRLIEVWGGMPVLFILIILASIVQPTFWL
ncbi:ABC transporter permease, partial [bacterium AH-315-B06]|nr:ABC transporter permease [bacterium AH-315-B06]